MKNIFDPLFVDPFFEGLDKIMAKVSPPVRNNFPFYDVIKISKNTYEIDIALAGFHKTDIVIETNANSIIVSGKVEPEDRNYISQGISHRVFKRTFALLDNYYAEEASMVNGILTIRVVRQAMKNFDTNFIEIK